MTGEWRCLERSNLSLTRPQRNLTGVQRRRCFGRSKLEAENKTKKCKIFYVFIISSFQLKSLGQTNLLLVLRREFTSSLLCLSPRKNCEFTSSLPCLYMCDGFLTSKPRLTISSSLPCLCDGFLTSKPRITIILDNLTSNDQIRTYSYPHLAGRML